MNDAVQQTLDLGREFREPADCSVPLVVDGVCCGQFVNADLRAQTERVLELFGGGARVRTCGQGVRHG